VGLLNSKSKSLRMITEDKSQGLSFEANIIGPESDLVRK
jgi:hypothetical protein